MLEQASFERFSLISRMIAAIPLAQIRSNMRF